VQDNDPTTASVTIKYKGRTKNTTLLYQEFKKSLDKNGLVKLANCLKELGVKPDVKSSAKE
jgi:hypothetical protein